MRLVFSLLTLWLVAHQAIANSVGEVTFVIGAPQATLNDQKIVLKRGVPVSVGMQIDTGIGSHAHVRFIDGTEVSIRPESRLVVSAFQLEGERLEEFRLTLTRGNARTISGPGLKTARDRFRLNTPIAAIGIRGTDFSTRVTESNTEVSVLSGAVVVSPLGEGCSIASLGPCVGDLARELSGGTGQILRLRVGQRAVQSVPALLAEPLSRNQNDSSSPAALRDSDNENKMARSDQSLFSSRVTSTESVLPYVTEPIPFTDRPDDLVEQTGALIWGHWFNPPRGDDWSPSAIDLLQAYQPTVSNANYGLFRSPESSGTLSPNKSRVALQLTAADATLTMDARTTPAEVTEGYLLLDFANSSFLSQLSVATDRAGVVRLNGAGSVAPTGIFVSRSSSDRMAGALGSDGLEAGMLFEKRAGNGVVQGISVWGQ